MKKIIFPVVLLVFINALSAQVFTEKIGSAKLNMHRTIKIKLPETYDEDSDLKYPVVVVFDGDYLFEPVAGHTDFQTYFDDMPGSIIVGIVQGEQRFYDGYYDEITGLPTESGFRFHQFVSKELLPHIDAKYRTSEFRVAVGHDLMGNFINSFLFQEEFDFKAYVAISPDFKGSISEQLVKRLENLSHDAYFYMATSDNDVPYIRSKVMGVHQQLSDIDDEQLTYCFDDFKGESHYTLVTGAISRAFDKMFDIYKPLSPKELEEKVLPYEGTLDTYLIDRYKEIEHLFGINKPITEEEIEKVAQVAEEREDLESLYKLGKLSRKLHPESPQGVYYMALHADRNGKRKKATKLYQTALSMGDSPVIDKEYIMSLVEEINLVTEDLDEEENEDEEN